MEDLKTDVVETPVAEVTAGETANVIIEEGVLAEIACYAAADVEGICEIAGLKTRDLKSRLGFKNAPNGIKIESTEDGIIIYIAIIIDSSHNIPDTTDLLRKKIKATIEAMTDSVVSSVNIKVAGLYVEKDTEQ